MTVSKKIVLSESAKKWLMLAIICFLTYLPSLWNQFVWDDEQFIYKNEFVKNFAIGRIFTTNTIAGASHSSNYYRPLTTLSFALDYQFWNLNPFGFHLVSTLLHVGAGLLLYRLLLLLNLKERPAWWISLFFLIHPIQTEAVVYANSRGDSLYTFWAMLGLVLLAKSFSKNGWVIKFYEQRFQIKPKLLVGLAVLCYAASVLSKEIGLASAGLFYLVGILKIWQLGAKNLWQKYWKQLLGLASIAIIAAGYLALRATVLNFDNSFNFYDDQNVYAQNLGVRALTFGSILLEYFRLLFVPFPLHMERNPQVITSWMSPQPWQALVVILAIIGMGWIEFKKKKAVWIWAGLCWFFIMLAPVSGIIPINGLMYEHWLYVPMIGVGLMLAGLASLIDWPKKFEVVRRNFGIVVAVIFAILTIRQNYFWSTPIRLYEHILKYSQSARLHNNLGMAYADQGRFQDSIDQYHQSLSLNPGYPQIHHNLGNTYLSLNQFDQAETAFNKALELDPNFFFSYSPLIQILFEQKKYEQSLQYINHLNQIAPDNVQVLIFLVEASIQTKDYETVKQTLAQIKQLAPTNLQIEKLIQKYQAQIP